MDTLRPDPTPSIAELLQSARKLDADALGELFGRYQPYLRLLAQRQLAGRLTGRIDPSDIVQQTFLEAQRDLAQFDTNLPAEFLPWLTRLLQNNVAQTIRDHVLAAKRSVQREQSLDGGNETTAVWKEPVAVTSSPSQRAMRGESAVELARLLDTLPPDQHEAVRLRHLEGWSLTAIAEHMNRSVVATAGLIKRGLQALRRSMEPQRRGDTEKNDEE